MPRFVPVTRDELSEEARELYDDIAGPREGMVSGPFGVWMLTPPIARAANAFGNELRLRSSLDKATFEMVTLICARSWRSDYPWAVHEGAAVSAGLSPSVIQAIAEDQTPSFDDERQQGAYDLTTAILRDREVPDALFERARAVFGIESLIELVTLVGFYSTASIVAKVFDVDLPARNRSGQR
jgi:4-carboxymuconolactone decarboxylase